MRFNIAAAALAAFTLAFTASAHAQSADAQRLREISVMIFNVCHASSPNSANDAVCACAAGYMGGALNDRELEVFSYAARLALLESQGASQAELEAVIQEFFAAGYTINDLEAVEAKLSIVAARGDAICKPYEDRNMM